MRDLMLEYHRRSDHGRDGAELDSFLCNCRALFDDHARSLLDTDEPPAHLRALVLQLREEREAARAHPDTMIGKGKR